MKIIRRIDPNKVMEIRQVINNCRDAGKSKQETIFFEYKKISDATHLEHALANYPLFLETSSKTKKKIINSDIMKLYNQEIRLFNNSTKDIDQEIVGVEYVFNGIDGKKTKICFRQIAEGNKAKRAADMAHSRAEGNLDKETRLNKMAEDPELKKRQDKLMREIQRDIDRKRKK